jgi:hypothetical protein
LGHWGGESREVREEVPAPPCPHDPDFSFCFPAIRQTQNSPFPFQFDELFYSK